jgi:hypothetical protein
MPDIPDISLADYHSAGRAAIVQSIDDAIRTLSQAGVPQARIQEAARRIDTACLTVLIEQDRTIHKLLAFAAQPRSAEHAKLIQSRIGWHMEQSDKAYAAIAMLEIQKVLEEFKQSFDRKDDFNSSPVIEVTRKEPGIPAWLRTLLHVTKLMTVGIFWLIGLCILTFLVWAASGSIVWIGLTLGLSFIGWLFLREHWWSVPIPFVAIGTLFVIF